MKLRPGVVPQWPSRRGLMSPGSRGRAAAGWPSDRSGRPKDSWPHARTRPLRRISGSVMGHRLHRFAPDRAITSRPRDAGRIIQLAFLLPNVSRRNIAFGLTLEPLTRKGLRLGPASGPLAAPDRHRLFHHGDRARRRPPHLFRRPGRACRRQRALGRRPRPAGRVRLTGQPQRLYPSGDRGADSRSTQPDPWDPARWCQPLDAMVAVHLEDRRVWIRPWLYVCTQCHTAIRFPSSCSTPTSTRTTPVDRAAHRPPLWRRRTLPADAGGDPRHRRHAHAARAWLRDPHLPPQ